MWTCPNCNRRFKNNKQSHMCSTKEIGELFENKPDDLVLAYDQLVQIVSQWEPFSAGAAVHSIVITSNQAWLIVKPMKKMLDIKFYHDSPIESERIKRITNYGKKYAHHIRIQHEDELDEEVFELLRMGFDYSLG